MSFHVDANQELSSRNEILARLNDAANDPGGKAKDEWKDAMEDTGNAVIARLSTRRRREPGQDELGEIPNDIQDRHLTKCFLFIKKPDNEYYMTSPEANDPKQRRRKRKLQTRVDGGYKKKSGDDDLQYPILPDPDNPDPMDALVRDAYRPDGTVLTIDFREMDAFLILESHLNSIEDFPRDDYFVIELYADLKSHLMEVIGEKNLIDGINGNCPQYYTRRYLYRKAVVGGREEYVPLCRQRGLDGQGQFAICHKGAIRRMVQNGNGVPTTTTDKYRIVVSFCMMMITSTVLLKVGPVNSQTDGAFIRYENGDCHDGHLIVASGIYHFRCFHARSLKIGSQAYISFNRDVLGQWDPTAVAQQQQAPQPPAQPQQPPQQQAPQPAPAQPPQPQPPAQHQQQAPQPPAQSQHPPQVLPASSRGRVMRIHGGGCDLKDPSKYEGGECPLASDDDLSGDDVIFIGVLVDLTVDSDISRPAAPVAIKQDPEDVLRVNSGSSSPAVAGPAAVKREPDDASAKSGYEAFGRYRSAFPVGLSAEATRKARLEKDQERSRKRHKEMKANKPVKYAAKLEKERERKQRKRKELANDPAKRAAKLEKELERDRKSLAARKELSRLNRDDVIAACDPSKSATTRSYIEGLIDGLTSRELEATMKELGVSKSSMYSRSKESMQKRLKGHFERRHGW